MNSSTVNIVDQDMSIYIPRVDTRSLPLGVYHGPMTATSKEDYEDNAKDFITRTFVTKNICTPKQVDLVAKQDTRTGHEYYIAFIHCDKWEDSADVLKLQQDMIDPTRKATVNFGDRYWICAKNNKKPLAPTGPKGPTMAELKNLVAAQNDTIASLQAQLDALQGNDTIPPAPKLKRTDNSEEYRDSVMAQAERERETGYLGPKGDTPIVEIPPSGKAEETTPRDASGNKINWADECP